MSPPRTPRVASGAPETAIIDTLCVEGFFVRIARVVVTSSSGEVDIEHFVLIAPSLETLDRLDPEADGFHASQFFEFQRAVDLAEVMTDLYTGRCSYEGARCWLEDHAVERFPDPPLKRG